MDEPVESMETEGAKSDVGEKDSAPDMNTEEMPVEESGEKVKENCEASTTKESESEEKDETEGQSESKSVEEKGDEKDEARNKEEMEKSNSDVSELESLEKEKNKDDSNDEPMECEVKEGENDSNKENLEDGAQESQTETDSAQPSDLETSSGHKEAEENKNEDKEAEEDKNEDKEAEEDKNEDKEAEADNADDKGEGEKNDCTDADTDKNDNKEVEAGKDDDTNDKSDQENDANNRIDDVMEINLDEENNDNTETKDNDNQDDEIIELEVYKKPAELVDLANDEELEADKEKMEEKDPVGDEQAPEGNRGIKLRSLASLVENENSVEGNDENSSESTISVETPIADTPAIGEILEHGEIIGSAEMGGLQLRISNVVGGEDSITGLSTDEDRDVFSNIQISSVTTLMDPMSPEDPNKDKEMAEKSSMNDHADEAGKDADSSAVGTIKIVNSESLANKDSGKEQGELSEEAKLRLNSSLSEEGKDDDDSNKNVFHILKSILTVNRICQICKKADVCEFRVKKKDTQGTHCFLCTQECKNKWTEDLPSDHVVEKARLIFEKLCGMCGKDLTTLSRKNQFSWETREFCTQNCLTLHLNEVAGKCHTCRERVRHLFIGKYCVRFGSDIHQFCSNTCLEYYKTKIKVCCYCQKNLEKVNKVTSTANKEYCSTKCLKRTQRRDIGQQNYNEKYGCTVCQTEGVNRYEFMLNGEAFPLCSDPCLNVYKYVNKVKAVACCLCFRVMNAEEVCRYLWHGGHQLRVFCSDSCVNVFILSARKIVVCDTCKVKKYNFDMIHKQIDEEFLDCFYCSLNCLKSADSCPRKSSTIGSSTEESSTNAVAITSTTASDSSVTPCNMCSTLAKAQFHMVMSDNTLRSFCRYACATKFKSTFGFQVDGVQTTGTQQSTNSAPLIRTKKTSQLTGDIAQTTDSTIEVKKKNAVNSAEDTFAASVEDLLKLLKAPKMVNKMTSCQPMQSNKGVYCKPHPWHKETQTESTGDASISTSDTPPVLPVPVPVYVPAPMMMYNTPCPVPIFVPIPLPVPIFIPTTAKTSEEIKEMMKKITDEMPSDPFEAEMLVLARAEKELKEKEADGKENDTAVQEKESISADVTSVANFNEIPEEEEADNDMESADVTCLNTIEEDLPVYPLRILGSSNCSSLSEDSESHSNRGKRKISNVNSGRTRKRLRRAQSNDSQSLSDPDDPDPEAEAETQPESIIEEDYQGPFLNKMYGLAAWKRWVTGKNAELAGVSSSRNMKLVPEDLLTMNCEELNFALCLFLKDLRKPNGEPYQPDTIYYLLLGIQQHLFESSRIDCIFMDFGFEKFTNSFDEIMKTYISSPTSEAVPSPYSLPITRITEAMLWECRQLGAHTPQVLLNTLFYFNVKVFKLRTVEDHQNMSFVQIVKQWRRTTIGREGSVSRTALLRYYPKKSTIEESKPTSNYEMHENRDDPLRCPVKLYEFYLSKCPESVRNQRNMYYVYPERSCIPNSPVWFSTQCVQAATLSKMLNRVLVVREVREALSE